MTDTTAQNLWTKRIPEANFTLYLFDKNKVRIGEATLTVSDVGPGETVKFQTTIASSGPLASISVGARYLPKDLGSAAPPKTISITVNTAPQGAVAKLDGTGSVLPRRLSRSLSAIMNWSSARKVSIPASSRSTLAPTTIQAAA